MKKLALFLICIFLTFQLISQNILTLNDCRKLAIENNRSLKIGREKEVIASEMRKAAFTQFLPRFSINGTYIHNQKNISLLGEDALLPVGTKMEDGSFGFRQDQINNRWMEISPGVYAPLDSQGKPFDPKANPEKIQWKDYALLPKEAMEMESRNIFAGIAGFVQPLYLGGKVRELYKLAKSSERLAGIEFEKIEEELLSQTDEAYWRVVSLKSKSQLATEYVHLIESIAENVSIMVDEGVATKGDILKVNVKINEAKMMQARADNGLALSKMALLQICGLNPSEEYIFSETPQIGVETITVTSIIDATIENRAEIRALEEAANIAKSNVKIMESRFLPNIVLNGNYIVSNPNFNNGISYKFGGMFSFGIGINIPLFHFGEKVHTLNAAKSQQKIILLQTEEAKEKIGLQINQANFRMAESIKRLTISEAAVKKAEENLRFAKEAYEAGVVNSTDLMEAHNGWLLAKSEKIDAQIDLMMCQSYLKEALGISLKN
jgi:outer membrane protein TolC